MTRLIEKSKQKTLRAAGLAIPLILVACDKQAPEHTQISEQPPEATTVASLSTTYQSSLSTRARVAYTDLVALAEAEVPTEHSDTGKQKVCKKILGMKACGNARWNYTITRNGDIAISGHDDFIEISIPMRFFGVAGIGGDVAKLIKLDKLDFAGALLAHLKLKIDLTQNWCPSLVTQVEYDWVEEPRLKWKAGVNLNLQDKVDKAIEKQLGGLQEQISNAIDCDDFRESVQAQWKQHSIPLDLPNNEKMYLNIVPNGFSFSGVRTEVDKMGLAFTLDAQTSVQSTALAQEPLSLPPLGQSAYQVGSTEFNLLIRADYEQLQSLAKKELAGRTFSETSAAGEVSVVIDDLELSGNPNGITINLAFRAKLPGKSHETSGNVYLTATPVLEAFSQSVRLENIALSNVLDSTLWNAIAAVFNKKIIAELQRNAVYELGPKLIELSEQLEIQLADPQRTGGLTIVAPDVTVKLEKLVPEQDNLAALLKVETQLDIEVPVQDIYRRHSAKR